MKTAGGKNMNTLSKNRHLTFLGILISIIIIMSFTPLGYLRTGGLEITFILLPVIIGSTVLKPSDGAVLGGVFGITSFIQCFGMSAFGATLLSINWFFTFITCFVPRVLAGWFGGLIFTLFKKNDKTKFLSYAVACLATPILNTVFFMGSIILFFYNTDFIQGLANSLGAENIFAFVALFIGINGVIEAVVCFMAGTAVSKALAIFMDKITLRA